MYSYQFSSTRKYFTPYTSRKKKIKKKIIIGASI